MLNVSSNTLRPWIPSVHTFALQGCGSCRHPSPILNLVHEFALFCNEFLVLSCQSTHSTRLRAQTREFTLVQTSKGRLHTTPIQIPFLLWPCCYFHSLWLGQHGPKSPTMLCIQPKACTSARQPWAYKWRLLSRCLSHPYLCTIIPPDFTYKAPMWPNAMVSTCNPSTQGNEATGLWFWKPAWV